MTETPERDEEEQGGSWLGELSIVTLIVSVVTIAAIVVYAMLLVIDMLS
jgi:hypothetical protein